MSGRNVFELSCRRIEAAIEAKTLGARDDEHFTWTPLRLDDAGWQMTIDAVDGLARFVADEGTSAATRLARSGEAPTVATALLTAFESPPEPDWMLAADGDRRGGEADPAATVHPQRPPSPREVNALVGPVRLEIMARAGARDISPASFREERGGSDRDVGRHFRALHRHGWLQLVGATEAPRPRRRGEHLYRRSRAPVLEADAWLALPRTVRAMISAQVYEAYRERVHEAIEAGTLDAREGGRFVCRALRLDQLGWEKLVARVDALFHFLFAVQAGARMRLTESGEEGFAATVTLAAFESPPGSV